MTTISKDCGVVTLVNVFTVAPENQQPVRVDACCLRVPAPDVTIDVIRRVGGSEKYAEPKDGREENDEY